MLSMKVKYALQALLYLAKNKSRPGNILSAEIAAENNIPKKFLDAILVELRKGGLLYSKKGRGGGYSLTEAESRIMVGQVIGILETPGPLPCGRRADQHPCGEVGAACHICRIEQQIRAATAEILDNTSLLDVAAGGPGLPLVMDYDV